MPIEREAAFGLFEDLLGEGLRPLLSGFRSVDSSNAAWPKGREGFFVRAAVTSTHELGVVIDEFARMQEIAARYGLRSYFVGRDSENEWPDGSGATIHGFVVSFEK